MTMAIYGNNEVKSTADPNHVVISEKELTLHTSISDPVLDPGNGNGMPIPPPPELHQFASPLSWSPGRKYLITTLPCGVTILAGYAAGAYSPPQAELAKAWKVSNIVYNLGITAYTLG